MLNKKNIACLIFVFISLKIYAEDDFNVISQCTDEYETSCDLVLINGSEKNIFLRNIKLPSIEEIGKDVFHVVSSCGSPCVGNYFIGKHAKDYTEELIKVDFKSKCIIESDSNEKKIYAKKIFSNTRKTLINLNEKKFDILPSKFNYYSDFNEMSYFDKFGNLNLIANDFGEILFKKKIKNPCGNYEK